MIKLCPCCGFKLKNPLLEEGYRTCDNCLIVFDNSYENKILSIAWVIRNWHIEDLCTLKERFNIQPHEIPMVKYVIDNCLSHDELLKVLKNQKISV